MFPNIGIPPNHPFNTRVHSKPSILGYHYFWKHLFPIPKWPPKNPLATSCFLVIYLQLPKNLWRKAIRNSFQHGQRPSSIPDRKWTRVWSATDVTCGELRYRTWFFLLSSWFKKVGYVFTRWLNQPVWIISSSNSIISPSFGINNSKTRIRAIYPLTHCNRWVSASGCRKNQPVISISLEDRNQRWCRLGQPGGRRSGGWIPKNPSGRYLWRLKLLPTETLECRFILRMIYVYLVLYCSVFRWFNPYI